MSEQAKLFTQADLAALNAQLDSILKNLNTHVNMSHSKAHALKIIQASYYDSGGDCINQPFSPITTYYVLEFNFGEPGASTSVYVPCRIVTDSTAHVQDPGPRTVSTGITFSATTPTGTSTSPGVPMYYKSLVTTSPSEVAYNQSIVHNDLLLMHQLCSLIDVRELQCHGGISFSNETHTDSLGHSVGRRTVNIGYNGTLYKMLGDTRSQGPPQGVRQLRCVTDSSSNPYHNRVHHSRDDSGWGNVFLLAYYGNTATIEWQVALSDGVHKAYADTWYTMNTGGGAASGSVPSGYGHAGSTWTTTVSPTIGLQINFDNGTDDDEWKHFVRAKATTPQGAVSYSNVCAISGNDEDGGLKPTWWGGVKRTDPDENKWTSHDAGLSGASTLYH